LLGFSLYIYESAFFPPFITLKQSEKNQRGLPENIMFERAAIKKLLKNIDHKPLSILEEKALLERVVYHHDAQARHRLVEANQRFVIRVALQFCNQGLSVSDLIQEGNLGLIEAIDRFDLDKNCRLVSYAAWWIRLFIQRAIEQKSRTVTIPINKIAALKKIKNFEYGFIKTMGRKPSYAEIADGIGMELEKVAYIYNLGTSSVSIYAEDDDGQTIEDRLEDHSADHLRSGLWLTELKNQVSKALDLLTTREQDVLRCRFGLSDDETPRSLRQTGRELGLSAEGVRQIQAQALRKLSDPEFGASLQGYLQAV
jgi:RNA polymerase primary sigma factor